MAEIPAEFLATFKLEKSENFEEFLVAKGVNWLMRKAAKAATITKAFSKCDDGEHYFCINKASIKTFPEWKFKLGESFATKHPLDGDIKVTFTIEGNCLIETAIMPDGAVQVGKHVIDGDYMIVEITIHNVTAKRFLKRQ